MLTKQYRQTKYPPLFFQQNDAQQQTVGYDPATEGNFRDWFKDRPILGAGARFRDVLNQWRNEGIPGETPLQKVGNMYATIRGNIADRRADTLGRQINFFRSIGANKLADQKQQQYDTLVTRANQPGHGYNPPGYNPPGYDPPSYNPPRYNGPGYNPPRHNGPGYNPPRYNRPRHNGPGYNPPQWSDPSQPSPVGSQFKDWFDKFRTPPGYDDFTKAIGDVDPNAIPEYTPIADKYFGDVGKTSTVGQYYAGTEKGALDTLNRLQNTTMEQFGQNVADLVKQWTPQDTELDKAINEQYLKAVRGELTDPNSQYYQAQNKLIDRAIQDEQNRMRMELGSKRGIGSGRAGMIAQDLSQRALDKKIGMLSELQKAQMEAADNRSLALKQLQRDLIGTASGAALGKMGRESEAAQAALSHAYNMGQLQAEQVKTMMQDAMNRINAAIQQQEIALKKAGLYGDASQLSAKYNIELGGLINNLLSTLFAPDSGILRKPKKDNQLLDIMLGYLGN